MRPEHLNDDRLGRVLDQLYLAGLTRLFVSIALKAAAQFGVATNTLHLDSSSFHVHGEYEANATELSVVVDKVTGVEQESDCESAPKPIHITHGYSRDKRADLKQFIIDLICSGDGDVPLYLRVADGNEADKAVFAKLMHEFGQQFCWDVLMVADSALYSAPNLKLLQGLRWISRVPLTVAEAKRLVDQLDEQEFVATSLPGYRIVERNSFYGGVTQKWVIVESEARRQADIKQFSGETLDNQLGQPTQRPTLRWVFQCFQDVHLLQVAGVKQIANLTPERVRMLRFLGSTCGRYYLLC